MLDGMGRVALITGAGRGYALSLGMRDPARTAVTFAHLDPARLRLARFLAEDWEGQARWSPPCSPRPTTPRWWS